MNLRDTVRQRDKLADMIGAPTEIVRGSLLERTIRHKKGCRTCAEGGGHSAWILSVNYPGGRNKDKLESICELNHVLLRSEE